MVATTSSRGRLVCAEDQPRAISHFWESAQPVVVLGLSGRIEDQVNQPACAADNVAILRRCSGGGAVVLAPGCLNYTLLFSLEAHPHFRNVARSFREILGPIPTTLGPDVQGQSALVYQARRVTANPP